MDLQGFQMAAVEFADQGVVAGDEVIDGEWNPLHVKLEGQWVHLTRDNPGPRAVIYTVPRAAIRAITWEPLVPSRPKPADE